MTEVARVIRLTGESMVMIDIEQAFDVLRSAGPAAFSVYFALESGTLSEKSIEGLAEACNMSREAVKEACYRLGLFNLGIKE
ncbi:hypothetical protein [Alicyclobacillus macrosporangiidus]|uniref:Uncharacterized protein n=1 Tax=Alicyclobacillus macrosporangiidus TaxID=392015 RepID=A0A1I7L222_9BACL|nr:hypothetical protein [Alicyclobacillus macrosporangiidus]SFV03793.1 hypothetical protein SAMN05421543_12340 [Alicyclobacillus macrosporangiidus]